MVFFGDSEVVSAFLLIPRSIVGRHRVRFEGLWRTDNLVGKLLIQGLAKAVWYGRLLRAELRKTKSIDRLEIYTEEVEYKRGGSCFLCVDLFRCKVNPYAIQSESVVFALMKEVQRVKVNHDVIHLSTPCSANEPSHPSHRQYHCYI